MGKTNKRMVQEEERGFICRGLGNCKKTGKVKMIYFDYSLCIFFPCTKKNFQYFTPLNLPHYVKFFIPHKEDIYYFI